MDCFNERRISSVNGAGRFCPIVSNEREFDDRAEKQT